MSPLTADTWKIHCIHKALFQPGHTKSITSSGLTFTQSYTHTYTEGGDQASDLSVDRQPALPSELLPVLLFSKRATAYTKEHNKHTKRLHSLRESDPHSDEILQINQKGHKTVRRRSSHLPQRDARRAAYSCSPP
jgi:hypothetical protein